MTGMEYSLYLSFKRIKVMTMTVVVKLEITNIKTIKTIMIIIIIVIIITNSNNYELTPIVRTVITKAT
jgi:hypothetical protein